MTCTKTPWRRRGQSARSSVIAVLAVLVFGIPATGHAEEQDRALFSGQATGVRAQILNLPAIVISDTGPIPASGDERETVLAEVAVPGDLTGGILTLNAEVLPATVVAGDDTSRAEASLARLDMTVADNTISAEFLHARASASCSGNTAVIAGSSEIVSLVINGQPIVVSGAPNQTIPLPTGVVIINEQFAAGSVNSGDITVNALHVVVTNPVGGDRIADVVVGSAHADILCQGQSEPACPQLRDFVTGGGWITGTPSGERANLAVGGGIKNGGLWGHLVYHDRAAGLKVKGTGVTGYEATGPTSRRIRGTCDINGAAGTYIVEVADNGEPGRQDTFQITLLNGYTASGTLAGGNIQLHGRCPQ
jgi:hypothetical protein